MDINEFLKKIKTSSNPPVEKKIVKPKDDELQVITRIISADADDCVIDWNGVPFGILKKDIVDIVALEGTEKNIEFGQLVSLIVKKVSSLECRLKMEVGEQIKLVQGQVGEILKIGKNTVYGIVFF